MFIFLNRKKAKIMRFCGEIHRDMDRERRGLLERKIRRDLDETLTAMEVRTKIVRNLDARSRTLVRRLIKVTNSSGVVI